MFGGFTDDIYERAKKDKFFEDFILKKEYDGERVCYPIEKPIVVFGWEMSDNMEFLLGYDVFEVTGRKLKITVMTDGQTGGAYCEECAKSVCMEIFRLDSEKLITSIFVDKCMYDKNNFACKVNIKFTIRDFVPIEQGG